mgnify:CR=1 FL=1
MILKKNTSRLKIVIKDKHSYVLYMEAINNLYNHYQQYYYDDDEY